jgi:type VI secretion system secreted protein VgrG
MEPSTRSRPRRSSVALGTLATTLLVMASFVSSAHGAIVPTVNLGTVTQFSILAGTTVTNTGPTTVQHDLGVSPGSAVVGFPPGTVTPPAAMHITDGVALQAQNDLTAAYNDAALRPTTALTGAELGGLTLLGGVYAATAPPAAPLELTGTLTLDGAGNASSVWIFQTNSTLTTAPDSVVRLINGASACNVFWQVGSSATLGTRTTFLGNILTLTSITLQEGVVLKGRTLARNGAVTLINDTFTGPDCTPVGPTSSTAPTGATTTSSTAPATTSSTGTATSTTAVTGGTSTTIGAGGSTSTTTTPAATATTATTTALTGGTSSTVGAGTSTSTTPGTGGVAGAAMSGATTTTPPASSRVTATAQTIPRTGQDIRTLLIGAAVALWLGVIIMERGRRRARTSMPPH